MGHFYSGVDTPKREIRELAASAEVHIPRQPQYRQRPLRPDHFPDRHDDIPAGKFSASTIDDELLTSVVCVPLRSTTPKRPPSRSIAAPGVVETPGNCPHASGDKSTLADWAVDGKPNPGVDQIPTVVAWTCLVSRTQGPVGRSEKCLRSLRLSDGDYVTKWRGVRTVQRTIQGAVGMHTWRSV